MDELMNALNNDDTSSMEILKDLISPENIRLKTELNMLQIKELVIIKWFAELDKPENKFKNATEIFNESVVPYLLELLVSKKRESRKETIKGIVATPKEQEQEKVIQ